MHAKKYMQRQWLLLSLETFFNLEALSSLAVVVFTSSSLFNSIFPHAGSTGQSTRMENCFFSPTGLFLDLFIVFLSVSPYSFFSAFSLYRKSLQTQVLDFRSSSEGENIMQIKLENMSYLYLLNGG